MDHGQTLNLNVKVDKKYTQKLKKNLFKIEDPCHPCNKFCLEIRCQVPKRFLNGNFTLESKDLISAKIEEKIIFECEDGFDLDGLESLECLEDGTWSDIPPICQPIPCTKPPM